MLDTKIETFLMICKYMNFTKAAEELHLTQPAVSSQMKRLEDYYGSPLFHYENKQLTLTEVGEVLYTTMKKMRNEETDLEEEIQLIKTKRRDLKFGATRTIGEFLLADPIMNYLKQFPDSSISMQVANTQSLLKQLDEGMLDFAFIEGNYTQSLYHSAPFQNSRFIAVCGRNCELKEGTHHLEDLFDERLIIREEGSGTRDIFETILTNKHHDLSEFSSLVEIGNMNAIKELLLRSVGISFLYEDVVKKELEEHQLFEITLDDFDVYHQMNVVWRKEKEHIQIIEEFLNVIHNEKKPF